MFKRIKVISVILIIAIVSLSVRIFFISYLDVQSTYVTHAQKGEVFGTNRGLILDRNRNPLVETQTETVYSKINPGFSAQVPMRYDDAQLCPHIIGYTDYHNDGVSGIEKDENAFLKSISNYVSLQTYTDARGRILTGKGTVINTKYQTSDSGICLCIDKSIQSAVQNIGSSLESGCIIVMNSDDGQILADCSFPLFSPNQITDALHDSNLPLINRTLELFNVGSVFKVVICMAALESGISEEFSYQCTGSCTCDGIDFHCHKLEGHGTLNMKEALALSCNTYFIRLAQQTGYQKILEMCHRLRLDSAISLSDSICSRSGNLPQESDLASAAALANFSFGQGELLLSPLHLSELYCVINNGGYDCGARLVEGRIIAGELQKRQSQPKTRVISAKTAALIRSFLYAAVKEGTGKGADTQQYLTGGKTATAQTGKYVDDNELLISYFIGICTIKGDNYTVLVMKENGTSGSHDCVPVFKQICDVLNTLEQEKSG